MAGKRLKMKDLERATGVGRETIRFYIREKLLPQPERAGRNVAWYDESFVERIALIKRLQSEQFLPLGIIKALVTKGEPLPAAEVRTLADIERGLHARERTAETRLPERLDRISVRTGIPVEEIRELDAMGALRIETRKDGEWLEDFSIRTLEGWADIRRHGLTAERGFGTDIVQIYVQMIEWLAREEVRMFLERATGKAEGDELTEMAEVGIEACGRMLTAMRERMLRQFIAEGAMPQTTARPAIPKKKKKA